MHSYSIINITRLIGDTLLSNHQYLDPGSGSMFIQVILATLAGFLLVFRGHLARFFRFIKKRFTAPKENDERNEQS
jgi:hypothetical protein